MIFELYKHSVKRRERLTFRSTGPSLESCGQRSCAKRQSLSLPCTDSEFLTQFLVNLFWVLRPMSQILALTKNKEQNHAILILSFLFHSVFDFKLLAFCDVMEYLASRTVRTVLNTNCTTTTTRGKYKSRDKNFKVNSLNRQKAIINIKIWRGKGCIKTAVIRIRREKVVTFFQVPVRWLSVANLYYSFLHLHPRLTFQRFDRITTGHSSFFRVRFLSYEASWTRETMLEDLKPLSATIELASHFSISCVSCCVAYGIWNGERYRPFSFGCKPTLKIFNFRSRFSVFGF